MSQVYQIHLSGTQMSGRVVRFRELTAVEVDEVALEAARQVDADSPYMKLVQLETREGVYRMLTAVSKREGVTADEAVALTDADWEPVNLQKLQGDPSSPWYFDRLFGRAKDFALLARTYRKYHNVDAKEIDDIVGKAVAVA